MDILIDLNHDNEEIYIKPLNATDDDSDSPFFKQEVWANYHMKPVSQSLFENQIKDATLQICSTEYESDPRPRLFDLNSGMNILLDSGAAVSIWPQRCFQNTTVDNSKCLQAVNGAKIKTHGSRYLKIRQSGITCKSFFLSS